MDSRRTFVKQIAAIGIGSGIGMLPGTSIGAARHPAVNQNNKKIWAGLLHLSMNFAIHLNRFGGFQNRFHINEEIWNETLTKMAAAGMNMVVISLEDAIKWKSHPEIALEDGWSVEKLADELDKIRKLGMEPIPLLNFSAAHDGWMREYSKMVSTKTYYNFCKGLIREICDIFNKPRFFHLGMDEETYGNQVNFDLIIIRNKNLWWDDLDFFCEQVTLGGARPWVWSDYAWHNPELFFKKMPKSVVQSNWYYGSTHDRSILSDRNRRAVTTYIDLESHGYDQIPTGSRHDNRDSILSTVKFCTDNISDQHLLGFLQSFWKPTTEQFRRMILDGVELTGEAKRWYLQYQRK